MLFHFLKHIICVDCLRFSLADINFALAVTNGECARNVALEDDFELSERWDASSFVSAASSSAWGDDGI